MIIPGFGIISHVIATYSGKPVFGLVAKIKLKISAGKGNVSVFAGLMCTTLSAYNKLSVVFSKYCINDYQPKFYVSVLCKVTVQHPDISCLKLLVTLGSIRS